MSGLWARCCIPCAKDRHTHMRLHRLRPRDRLGYFCNSVCGHGVAAVVVGFANAANYTWTVHILTDGHAYLISISLTLKRLNYSCQQTSKKDIYPNTRFLAISFDPFLIKDRIKYINFSVPISAKIDLITLVT